MWMIRIFVTYALLLFLPLSGQAQPTVTLTVQQINKQRYVLFTFEQADTSSMNGCHYNLFAADKKSDLSTLPGKGRSIATFFKSLTQIQIISGPLPRLKLLGGAPLKASIYFRTLLSCPAGTNGFGAIQRIRLTRSLRGTVHSIDQMTRKMKHSMQYYGDSIGK